MASRPERAFRIADRRHEIFDGIGAFLNGGRWNSPGHRIIYAADSFAGAMLEILVHTRIGRIPHTHVWMEIEIPAEVSIEEVVPENLPGWDSEGSIEARRFGDEWHRQRRSAILLVPSVITFAMSRNVLLNQEHPEFRLLRPGAAREIIWDHRLFRP